MKFKRISSFILATLVTASMFSGCGSTPKTASTNDSSAKPAQTSDSSAKPVATADNTKKALTGTLTIDAFTNENLPVALAFEKANPGVKVKYNITAMDDGVFQQKLQQELASNSNVPDVCVLESSFVKQFVDSPFLTDLTDMKPKADAIGVFPFTYQISTSADGKIKGYSYQASPGGLYYRRSLAKKYLGTDDPDKVQEMVSTMDKFQQVAATIKEKSNGDTYTVGSVEDFSKLYFSNRERPWIVDNTLTIDPKITELFNEAKTFSQNGYEAQAKQWEQGWNAGMNDTLVDAKGVKKQIFCYFLPTWGLPSVLMEGSKGDTTDTAGDWAFIPGPVSYQWGGSWYAIPKTAKNPELAKAFVEFGALNAQTLKDWVLGTYTHEYLKAIDPTIADDLAQPAGDFVSSKQVMDEVTPNFASSDASKFLGGENPYPVFEKISKTITTNLIQGTDSTMENALSDPISAYATGKNTLDQSMAAFKKAVQAALPDVTVK